MDKKFCPNCGTGMEINDRFCANCGFDYESINTAQINNYNKTAGNNIPSKSPSGNKNTIIMVSSILALLLIAGGVLAFWLSRKDGPASANKKSPEITEDKSSGDKKSTKTDKNTEADKDKEPEANDSGSSTQPDITNAGTYLPEPGTVLAYFSNYIDGQSGYVKRVYGKAVPDESVVLTEVEILTDMGEEIAFGSHYVLRADGLYFIDDYLPFEINPVLKNNMQIGSSWKKTSEYGDIIWTVADMGVTLDLGFQVFQNCIIVHTDNQAVDLETLTYYAPGIGMIYEVSAVGNHEFYKLTGIEHISEQEARDMIIKWCPNYLEIKDDRTQNI